MEIFYIVIIAFLSAMFKKALDYAFPYVQNYIMVNTEFGLKSGYKKPMKYWKRKFPNINDWRTKEFGEPLTEKEFFGSLLGIYFYTDTKPGPATNPLLCEWEKIYEGNDPSKTGNIIFDIRIKEHFQIRKSKEDIARALFNGGIDTSKMVSIPINC